MTSTVIANRGLLAEPHCPLGQSEPNEKSSLWLTIVHSVTTFGLLPPYWKLTVINWAGLGLSESTQIPSLTHGNCVGKQLPVCCRHEGFVFGIDWSSLAQSESDDKTRQRVFIVEMTRSKVTLLVRVMLF